jgi:hypothetical protein
MGLDFGDQLVVDHKNHDKLDNRKANLRVCTNADNAQNKNARGHKGSSSQYRGVSLVAARSHRPNPWAAYCRLDGKHKHLGFYATEEEAADVARRFRAEHLPYTTN